MYLHHCKPFPFSSITFKFLQLCTTIEVCSIHPCFIVMTLPPDQEQLVCSSIPSFPSRSHTCNTVHLYSPSAKLPSQLSSGIRAPSKSNRSVTSTCSRAIGRSRNFRTSLSLDMCMSGNSRYGIPCTSSRTACYPHFSITQNGPCHM